MKNGIVFFPQRIDICLDRFRVKRHLSALAHNPARNGICVQNFPLRSKCIGYGRIHIVLQLFKCLPEGRIFRSHLRFLITPCRLQIYLFFQTVYGRLHHFYGLFPVQTVSPGFCYQFIAAPRNIIPYVRIRGIFDKILLEAPQCIDFFFQRRLLVKGRRIRPVIRILLQKPQITVLSLQNSLKLLCGNVGNADLASQYFLLQGRAVCLTLYHPERIFPDLLLHLRYRHARHVHLVYHRTV